MIYAHVTNGIVDQVGTPPPTANDGTRDWDLRTLDPVTLAKVGWLEVIETPRPADTATNTSDLSYVPEGGKAVQTWTIRAKTTAEKAGETEQANNTTIRDQARTALVANRNFLAIASPTNAQIAAQVKALTRQNNGVIRLVLNDLAGTD